jgi:hypothetical protein
MHKPVIAVSLSLGCVWAPLTAGSGSDYTKAKEVETQKKKYNENVRQHNANQPRQAPKAAPAPKPASAPSRKY